MTTQTHTTALEEEASDLFGNKRAVDALEISHVREGHRDETRVVYTMPGHSWKLMVRVGAGPGHVSGPGSAEAWVCNKMHAMTIV